MLNIEKILAVPAVVSSYVMLLFSKRKNPKNNENVPKNIERISSIEPTLKSNKKY